MPVFALDAAYAPLFYSALSRQIDKTVTKSASPLHWGETIMSASFAQQGVMQDEIQWSGVLNWLLMQQQAGAAKAGTAQLLSFPADNGMRVTEASTATAPTRPTRARRRPSLPCAPRTCSVLTTRTRRDRLV
jgi:hypothetical protein